MVNIFYKDKIWVWFITL